MATAQAICGSSYHEFQTLLSIKQPTAKAMADVTSSGKQEGSGSPELRSRFDSTSTALPREEEDGEMEEMEKVQVDPFASLEAKDPSEDPSEEDPDLVLELELDLEEEGTLEEEGEDEMRSDLQWWDWRAVYAADFRFLKASSFLPPLEWLPSYFRFLRGKDVTNESDVVGELSWSAKGDCIAGLTVGLMLVPQSLAFARLSGLPMRTGFYSSVLPLLVYAMFGTMRQLQIGPTAVVGMLAGQALDSAGFFTDEEHIDGAAQIAIMRSLSTAMGTIIATSQLKDMVGVTVERQKCWWQNMHGLAMQVPEIEVATAALGFTLFMVLSFMKSWKTAGRAEQRKRHWLWRCFPCDNTSMAFKIMVTLADLSSVVCIIIGWVWGFICKQASVPIQRVGDLSSVSFQLFVPGLSVDSVGHLAFPSAMIAVVGFLGSVAAGSKPANEHRYRYDSNQELVALGLANMAGATMAGFPITGAIACTTVGRIFGATSQFAGALTALTVFAGAMLLLPVIEELPYAALSPIVIQGGLAATDFKSFGMAFRGNRTECLIMIATLAMSLGTSVIEGLLLGIGLSVFQLVHNVARPNIVICGQVADGTFRDLRYYPDAHLAPGCVVVRMDASLCFPNTRRLQEFCLRAAAMASGHGKLTHLILDCRSMNGSDITGCAAVENLAIALKKQGVSFVLSNLKESFARAMFRTKLDQSILRHSGHFCWTLDHALALAAGGDPEKARASVLKLRHRITIKNRVSRHTQMSAMVRGSKLGRSSSVRFSASGTSQRNTAISVGSRTSRASKASRSSKAQELSELP
ncbi:SULTR2 [Symbiodinium microadriaticum]|nr:SULTR2 [Symbiodinium microadriaticum]